MAPSFLLLITAALVAAASLSLSPAWAADSCHPEDKKALLEIKRFWNDPDRLSEWVPFSDCCTWSGVVCHSVTGRVTTLSISSDPNITGTIPPTVGDLTQLRSLDISKLPHITGSIPSSLARLRNLAFLRLERNDLTGPIPTFLMQLPKLWYLGLEFNRLTGSIPSAIPNHSKLQYVGLEHNQLTGAIPIEFGTLPSGTVLLLSHNNLFGRFPPALAAVDFSVVNVASNRLSGDATFLFGLNKKKLNLIDLSWNMFQFDLSRVVFPTVPQLHTINLNHNRIYGRIPKQIADLADLESLDVSYNRLCGEIPTGGKLDGFKAEVYTNNPCLCGKPLPPCK